MRAIITSILISFLLGACGTTTQPAAPTMTATIPPTSTPAPTETPTATFTPESQLPVGQLRELQERLGSDFTLVETEEKDSEGNLVYQIVDKHEQPVSDIKVFKDGSSESIIDFNGEQYTAVVPLQTISVDNDKNLVWSGWKIENGEKVIFSSPAPKSVEEINSFAKLGIIEGHAKEQQMVDTVHKYAAMTMAKSEIYDPANEFKGIDITLDEFNADGTAKVIKNIDLKVASWIEVKQDKGGMQAVAYAVLLQHYHKNFERHYHNARPSLISVDRGSFNLKIFESNGDMKYDFLSLPIVFSNSDRSTTTSIGLINKGLLNQEIVNLMTRKDRGELAPFLIRKAKAIIDGADKLLLSDEYTRQFFEKYNAEYFKIHPDLDTMSSVPKELTTDAFFDFVDWRTVIIYQAE